MRPDFPRRAGGLAGDPHRGSNDRMIDARKRYVALFGGMGACMVGVALATVLLLPASIPVLLAGLR